MMFCRMMTKRAGQRVEFELLGTLASELRGEAPVKRTVKQRAEQGKNQNDGPDRLLAHAVPSSPQVNKAGSTC